MTNIIGKIHNESCLDTLGRTKDETVDSIITSPPYDDLRTYKGYSFPFESIAKELTRVLKPGGVIVWVVGDATIKNSETLSSFKQAMFFVEQCGLCLYDTMIYQKTGTPFPSRCRYNQTFEYMFVFTKGKPKTFRPLLKKNVTAGAVRHSRKFRQADGTMKAGFNGKAVSEYGIENNIWKIRNGMYKSTKDKVAFGHPAIFPEELVEKHILTWTNPGDVVYDPFMGSGTTAKMSIIHGRKWFGSELSNDYCEIAKVRLATVAEATDYPIQYKNNGFILPNGTEEESKGKEVMRNASAQYRFSDNYYCYPPNDELPLGFDGLSSKEKRIFEERWKTSITDCIIPRNGEEF